MKQIRTVRHSFNTTGTANYRVQLAVLPSTNNNNNIVLKKKLTNKYNKKLGICIYNSFKESWYRRHVNADLSLT